MPPLPVLLFDAVVLQLNWGLLLPSVLILLTECPLGEERVKSGAVHRGCSQVEDDRC